MTVLEFLNNNEMTIIYSVVILFACVISYLVYITDKQLTRTERVLKNIDNEQAINRKNLELLEEQNKKKR